MLEYEWNYLDRNKYLKQLKEEKFELIIIGGGLTGAGITREAALRGIKTALIDKNDFAFGTSSRSSKLTHGGFRYLSSGEFGLVRQSCTERNWLRTDFPNLVRPLAFNIASYEDGYVFKPWKIKFGIRLYDFLSNFFSKYKNYGKHKFYKKDEILKEEKTMKSDGLVMVGQYYDTNVDDSRLTIETIKESVMSGHVLALNYVRMKDYNLEKNKIVGIKAIDEFTKDEFVIKGTQVINATGIWTDEQLRNYPQKVIRPTKGVHIMVRADRIGNKNAFGVKSIDDGRFFFILRREDFSLIGTTDTDYHDNLDEPWCEKEDCDYLFKTVNMMFPNAKLTYDDIVSTYAGIRPLVMEQGKAESDISRKHKIFDTPDGLVTIAGGKHTIFRLMGEELIFYLLKKKKIFDKIFPKNQLKKGFSKKPFQIGLKRNDWDSYIENQKISLEKKLLDHLYQQYGKGAFEIIEIILKNPKLAKTFTPENVFMPAEIFYILRHEFAPCLIDVMCRRTEMQMKVHHTKQREVAEQVAQIMAEKYKWSSTKKDEEIEKYMNYIKKSIWF